MPVIVNELVVKATVEAPPDETRVSGKKARQNEVLNRKEIIEECVEHVLKIIEQREER